MKSEWKLKKLSEIAEIYDSLHQTPQYAPIGVPMVRVTDIKTGLLSLNRCLRVEESVFRKFTVKHIPQKHDIVISRVGSYGNFSLVPDDQPFCLGQNTAIIAPKINALYLYYFLISDFVKHQIEQKVVGSTQKTISLKSIKELDVIVPDERIQNKIASLLWAIDDKIELNNRLNENLEQQARELFRAWFVDYIPSGGTPPTDWRSGKLKDVLALKRKPTKAGENPSLPYLPIDVIPMNTFALSEVKPNEDAQSSLVLFNKDDILIGAMRVYFHRVVIAPFDGITRTTCFTLCPYDKEYLSFGLLCCDQDSTIKYAQSTSKGSTMPYAVWDGGLGDMDIIIPDKKTAQEFNTLILPMIRIIQNSFSENSNLRAIRDQLLPKLMSGELDVSEVEL